MIQVLNLHEKTGPPVHHHPEIFRVPFLVDSAVKPTHAMSATVQSAGLVPMSMAPSALPAPAVMLGGAKLKKRALRKAPTKRAAAGASSSVATTGITKAPFLAQGELGVNVGSYRFEDKRGQSVCWRLGRVSAAEFIEGSGVYGMGDQLFHTNKVKIFYPIADQYFATRSVTINGSATAARVVKAIEQTAHMAISYHLKKDRGVAQPTSEEVAKELSGAVVCHLMCRRVGGGNHVYVRLT